GYAQITSGRHNATACATASEPSICLSMHGSIHGGERELVGDARSRDISRAHLAGKFFLDRLRDRFELQLPADRRESAEQRRIGQRAPYVLQRKLRGRHRAQMAMIEIAHEF